MKDKVIEEVDSLPPKWKFSFKIKPFKVEAGWTNVMHATIGKNYGRHGDRTPGIWFIPDTTKFQVATCIDDKSNAIYKTSTAIPLNQYSTVVVQQTPNAKNKAFYDFQVIVNGKIEVSVVNKKPRTFKKVKYYASDPWYEAPHAAMKDFKIEKFSA